MSQNIFSQMSLKNIKNILLALSLSFLFLSSCSTQKNKWANRKYHGITAKYNILFNGEEAYKTGMRELAKKSNENYTTILPVFPRYSKNDATSIAPHMDRLIEKAGKAVKKHSMFIKGKEHNKYIPYSYLMMGKAFYHKQDYETAQRTFNFIINNYKEYPITSEANIWMARTTSEMGEMTRSDLLFDELKYKFDGAKNKKTLLLYNMAYADFMIKTEDYQTAITTIQDALRLKPKKKEKTRLLFILGQLYQETGSMEAAFDNFKKVIKLNPPYEMAFNARINMAKCVSLGSGDKEYVNRELGKMIADKKNEEYLDIIYYTLAEIALMDPDEELAVENLTLSVEKSVSNDYQKSVSALKLADIHYKNLEYKKAQQYYDTTMAFLPEDFPNFEEIKVKNEILTNLVKNLLVIETQDSLQRIAKMPESQRNQFIDKLIAEYIEQERIRQEEERQRQIAIAQANMNRPMDFGSSGAWYFYNPQSVAYGKNEFSQKWGNRKLEDNWRLSNKRAFDVDFGEDDDEIYYDEDGEELAQRPTDPKNRETYLVDLPLTEEKMQRSTEMIIKAYYNVGFIYRDGLKDIQKFNETFEIFVERFPDHQLALQAAYTLYMNYTEDGNVAKANHYKNFVLNKAPDSDYAELIRDPNFYKKIEERAKEGEKFYSNLYEDFQNGDYQNVINNVKAVEDKYRRNKDLQARIDYLESLSNEFVYGRDSLVSKLENFIEKHDKHLLKERAQVLLNSVKTGADIASQDAAGAVNEFTADESAFYFYILVADIRVVDFYETKILLSDFNRKYYRSLDLKVDNMYLDNTTQMITVSRFNGKQKAMEYYNFIKDHKEVMDKVDTKQIKQYVLTDASYVIYQKQKDRRQEYDGFFKQNYLKR